MEVKPQEIYKNEIAFINILASFLEKKIKALKKLPLKHLTVQTVKIAFILDNGEHMHKDIDFGGL